jgi:membrane protein implicated in regulation of membrane protease activity
MSGHAYLAIISGSTGLVLFAVKSMEIIRLARVEERKLIGQRCLVIKRVGKAGTGVVRVYDRTGRLNPELWSAESTCEIPEGEEAQIEGMRSIVLLIVPGES